jgi:hypothetical protein
MSDIIFTVWISENSRKETVCDLSNLLRKNNIPSVANVGNKQK